MRYIIATSQKWGDRFISIAYSTDAAFPRAAAIKVFYEHANLHKDIFGEMSVQEAKAGRLADYCSFYDAKKMAEAFNQIRARKAGGK